MGSSCSTGSKDKNGGKCALCFRKRGSNASTTSVYQKASTSAQGRGSTPTPLPEGHALAEGGAAAGGDASVTTTAKIHPAIQRVDSENLPMSPLSPTQQGRQSTARDTTAGAGTLPDLSSLPNLARDLLFGNVRNLRQPLRKPNCITLVICADPTDTNIEREMLREQIYSEARLRCAGRGFDLDVVDLAMSQEGNCSVYYPGEVRNLVDSFYSGGHSESAGAFRTQYSIPERLATILFMNETVGELQMPVRLPVSVVEDAAKQAQSDKLRRLLQHHYVEDPSTTEEDSLLLRIEPKIAQDLYSAESSVRSAAANSWSDTKHKLIGLLQATPSAHKYLTSVLETVCEAIGRNRQFSQHCIWISRTQIASAASLDPKVEMLRETLAEHIEENRTLQFRIRGGPGDSDHKQYLEELNADFGALFNRVLDGMMSDQDNPWPQYLGVGQDLFSEMSEHTTFCQTQLGETVTTDQMSTVLRQVKDYVTTAAIAPLVLYGPSGCGKTALAARIANECVMWIPEAAIVFRFAKLTSQSNTVEGVLWSIGEQCCVLYGDHPSDAARCLRDVDSLPCGLAKANASRPLIIIVDGADRLVWLRLRWYAEEGDAGQEPHDWRWVPAECLDDVKVIVTVANDDPASFDALQKHLPTAKYVSLGGVTNADCVQISNEIVKSRRRTLQKNESAKKIMESTITLPINAITLCARAVLFSHPFYLEPHSPATGAQQQPELNIPTGGAAPQIRCLLDELERCHGSLITTQTISYLLTASQGLTTCELIDSLSCDSEVRKLVDSCLSAPFNRVAHVVVTGVLNRLGWFLTRVISNDGRVLIRWFAPRDVTMAVEDRYGLATKRIYAQNLASYYDGSLNKTQKELTFALDQVKGWGGGSNPRRLEELPHLLAGRLMELNLDDFVFNPKWLLDKLSSGEVVGLLEVVSLYLAPGANLPKESLRLLVEVVTVSGYALKYDGTQFLSQVYARLHSYFEVNESVREKYPKMYEIYLLAATNSPTTILLPISQSFLRPPYSEELTLDEPDRINWTALYFLKDSPGYIVSLSEENSQMVVWNVYDGSRIRTLDGITLPKNMQMIDRHRAIVLCNRELKVYNLDECTLERKITGMMNQKMPFYGLHDSEHVVTLSRNRMYVNLVHLESNKCVAMFKVGEDRFLNSLLVSANGKVCVCGDETQKPFPLLVWDLSLRKLVYDLRIPHHEFITKLSAITNDGHYAVCVCKELDDPSPNFIIVYDLQNGTLFKKWKPEVDTCSVAISSAGGCVISGLVDISIVVWDLVAGACRFVLLGHSSPVDSIKIDDLGQHCLSYDSTANDLAIRLWDTSKGLGLASFVPDHKISCAELSPDGNFVAMGLKDQKDVVMMAVCLQAKIDSKIPAVIPPFGNEDNKGKAVELGEAG